MKLDLLKKILPAMRCPLCGAPLSLGNGESSLLCTPAEEGRKRHCFDVARRGYVNLDNTHAGGGDGKEAVAARTAFLTTGAYQPISDAVNDLLHRYAPSGLALDAGCGEGYYTNRAAKAIPTLSVVGCDLSKSAIDAAMRMSNENGGLATFLVAGIFALPFGDETVDAVISLFAPCAEEEFLRVLKPGGVLILVGAGEDHLLGLKKAIYENPYRNTDRADLPVRMELLEERRLTYTFVLDHHDKIAQLFSMTPYRFRTSRADLEKLERLTYLETEADVNLYVYRKV